MRLLSKLVTSRTTMHPFPPECESLLSEFLLDCPLTTKSYEKLFLYFIEGFETFRSQSGASANYQLPSKHGKLIDQMEGVFSDRPTDRSLGTVGSPSQVRLADGRVVDLVATFVRGLILGLILPPRLTGGRFMRSTHRRIVRPRAQSLVTSRSCLGTT